jgi:hypothetical protein
MVMITLLDTGTSHVLHAMSIHASATRIGSHSVYEVLQSNRVGGRLVRAKHDDVRPPRVGMLAVHPI